VNWFGGGGYVGLRQAEAATMRCLALPVIRDRDGRQLRDTRPYVGPGGDAVCAAFAGTSGTACSCSVYQARPEACRAFEPGTLKRMAVRFEAGLGSDPLAHPGGD
jgi:Fe-S-cluster containining protein